MMHTGEVTMKLHKGLGLHSIFHSPFAIVIITCTLYHIGNLPLNYLSSTVAFIPTTLVLTPMPVSLDSPVEVCILKLTFTYEYPEPGADMPLVQLNRDPVGKGPQSP